MHVFQVAFYGAGVYYALFIDRSALFPFFAILASYFVVSAILPGAKSLSTRKKIMSAAWSEPSEPNIIGRVEIRTEKVQKLLDSLPKESRLSMTHFCIKAVGQILATHPFMNGLLTFGKFVPYDTVDVSCLVDIGNGKDLAMVCIKEVDKKSIKEIGEFIKEKTSKMRRTDGGEEHKKQTGLAKFLPVCLLSMFIQTVSFLTYKVGLNLGPFKIPKRGFGAAYITSLGPLGYEDGIAPFTGFLNASFLLAANAVVKKPVVEGDKIVVGDVMQCNFMVDHRYMDGGNAKRVIPNFKEVFENPEKFLNSSGELKQD